MKSRFACLLALLAGCAVTLSAQSPTPGCPTAPAMLVRPANGAADVQSPVEFDWSDVTGATSYQLIASFNGGTPSTIAVTRDSEYSASVPGGPVEWWVVATSQSCTGLSSLHSRFTAVGATSGCPAVTSGPQPISPANGAMNLNSPVTFSWTSVNGAIEYRLRASINGAAAVLLGTTTNTQLTASVPAGEILWYVEAAFQNCPSTYSGRSSLTVMTGGSCNGSPTTLIAPANNASNVSSPVTFQWSKVAGATAYKLFVLSSTAVPDLIGTTTDTSLVRLVPDGAVTWWVDTSFAGCPDVRSAQFRFTVAPSNACAGSIALLTPANGATVASPVTLAWTAVPNATIYRVWVSIDGGPSTVLTRSGNAAEKVNLPSGNVDWYVEALFTGCPSIVSPHRQFIVSKSPTCAANAAPVLTSPVGGAQVSSPVDFNWSPASGALLYRVWVSVNGDPFVDLAFTRSSSLKEQVLPSGAIQWYAEAFFDSCAAVASSKATFVIPQTKRCGSDAPLPVTPADGENNVVSPVTFVWTAIADATEYRVFASVNGSDFALIAKTSNTSVIRPLPPGTFTWFVESITSQCPGTRSSRSRFTVAQAANCSTDAPQLVAPANAANNVASPVRLDWNPVSGAVAYSVFIRRDGGSPTRLSETLDPGLIRPLPEGSYEWWVVAFFSGCPATESQHGTFTIPPGACNSRRPLNQSPIDGASGLGNLVRFAWSHVPNAKSYKCWASIDDQGASVIGTTAADKLTVALPAGPVQWYVEALFDNCPSTTSAVSAFAVRKSLPACSTPDKPQARVAAQVESGTAYNVRWTAAVNSSNYELQESTTGDFKNATTQIVSDISVSFTHPATQPARYFYRVRAISNCSDDHGPYSKIVSAVVIPAVSAQRHTTVEIGTQAGIVQQVFVAGQTPPLSFTARTDKPWLTVTPSSGTLGPEGVTFTVTSDPAALNLGTNTGTIILTYGAGSSGRIAGNGVAPANVPVSVSLVTPVSSTGKNTPPPDSLIIPAVGHAPGLNDSLFESDVRVLNTSAQTMKYQLNFTLSGTDGTQSGNSTTIEIDPGATMALDDILMNFFGIGSDGGAATGTLEIRPLTSSTTTFTSSTPSIQTVASSRTYNTTQNGTYGQFIPAVPFSQFIGKSDTSINNILSLQQIAQSTAYRTNVGLVEGAGENADVLVHVLNDAGTELAQIPVSLQPGEHKQLNELLKTSGITLNDGRLEVEVTSATGKVTAYASVLDNVTNDPLLVSPVLKSSVTSTRYVLPGVGDFDIGIAHWKSDVRLFNTASTSVPVTLTYSIWGDPTHPRTSTMTLQAGEVQPLDNLIRSQTWSGDPIPANTAGSLLVTTTASSSLVATARTYTQGTSGTYGQFIPAVTPAQSVGLGGGNLQLLQLEASDRFRTNIGLAETSGNAATAHISLILPDSKFAISTDIPLKANEFQQISLASFGAGTVYNGRVTVSVKGGSGRVTAYGSVIDQQTQDPTYVPAQ
jgi:hypothetical protein